jgi:hypothetical protein
MPNLAAYTEMMIDIHRQEVISQRRQLVHTANGRLDVKRRIADQTLRHMADQCEAEANELSERFGIGPKARSGAT